MADKKPLGCVCYPGTTHSPGCPEGCITQALRDIERWLLSTHMSDAERLAGIRAIVAARLLEVNLG